MVYDDYDHLLVDRCDGVATITINRPDAHNAANARMHDELGRIWLDVARDDDTKVAVITGAGTAFCAGADFSLIDEAWANFEVVVETMQHGRAVVQNLVALDKPVISAINGVAVGAGLTVALLADISIASSGVRLTDGHAKLGIVAGDHAALLWPLLCGMAKAKHLLLTSDFITAEDAERAGLISLCVEPGALMATAHTIAERLANGSSYAIQWTKRSLNGWLRQAMPIFEHSLALEMMGLFGPDVREGVNALREKRPADFASSAARRNPAGEQGES
jgi:enoyl-CoA hydratase